MKNILQKINLELEVIYNLYLKKIKIWVVLGLVVTVCSVVFTNQNINHKRGDLLIGNNYNYNLSTTNTEPVITIVATKTSLVATDNKTSSSGWYYVLSESPVCDSTIDFSGRVGYTEGTSITIDSSSSSSQFGKYYCFFVGYTPTPGAASSNVFKRSSQIGGSPTIEKISAGMQTTYGVSKKLTVRVHFTEPVNVTLSNNSDRTAHISVNSQAEDFESASLNGYEAELSDLEEGIVAFSYSVQVNDYNADFQINKVILTGEASIRDSDGNDAILDLDGLSVVNASGEPTTILIDARKPTIRIVKEAFSTDFDGWAKSRSIQAGDDEDDNGNNWDYHFIPASAVTPDEGQTYQEAASNSDLIISCYLGDYLPLGGQGTPYVEQAFLEFTEDKSGFYVCMRSRRSNQDLWDTRNNRDYAGALYFIEKIDNTAPTITPSIVGAQLSATAVDSGSGVKDDSLRYKVVTTPEECTVTALESGTTTYTDSITLTESNIGQHFCFGAEDLVGNVGHNVITVLDNFPPIITVVNPDMTELKIELEILTSTSASDIDNSSWLWKAYDSSQQSCNQALMSAETKSYAGASVTLTDNSYNGQKICFSVSDTTGNLGFAESETITNLDSAAPQISFTYASGQMTVNVVDDNLDSNSLIYKLIAGNEACDEDALSSDTSSYSDGEVILITAEHNNHKFCFTASDTVDNQTYLASRTFGNRRRSVDNTPPSIIVVNPENSNPATTKIVRASSTSNDVVDSSWVYIAYNPESQNCNQDLIASKQANAYVNDQQVVLNDSIYNQQRICFSVEDESGNVSYAESEIIEGIDHLAPVITITVNGNQISAGDNDEGATTWTYQIISQADTCNQEALTNASTYIENTTLYSDGLNNQKVCFKVQDVAGNTAYQSSIAFSTTINQVSNINRVQEQEEQLPPPIEEPPELQSEVDEDLVVGGAGITQEKTPISGDSNLNRNLGLIAFALFLLLLILFFFRRQKKDEEESSRQTTRARPALKKA